MRLVILGAGESGVGTALLGKQKGYDVFVSDFGAISEKYQEVLRKNTIDWEQQQHTEAKILNADVVVKSPGIPDKAPIVKKLHEKDIKVISEIEFVYQFAENTSIAITGSNGKTTTTLLTYHLLKQEGLNVGLAGNIGESYAKQVATHPDKLFVLELSSFQLDGNIDYNPHIAVITNISPDHLDRYDYKYDNYIASKFRITVNQTEEDYLIYDADDEAINNWLKNNTTKAQLVPFSLTKKFDKGAYLENNNIIAMINNEEITVAVNEIAIEGKHNLKNAMAATLVAQMMRVRKQTIRESLSNFQNAEHRLEKVAKINKVQYINDSKATNVNATYFALESMTAPTVWIVGGVDKGNDYDELMSFVHEKVKAIVCLGIDNEKIKNAFGSIVDIMVEATSMAEAVKLSAQFAEEGDTVLLSPACASFDLFKSYEDRGAQFKNAVQNL
ncbi:UDP-N-acetylmuramoyl-L-alanine--D-glutamate ligase [Flavobacterium sp. xlx-214]|uniref:UDP-N-acetylmuramoyl-L-alanine--D-glutamate ligase n=1 Tax=unclassified Flavobacterium TaxID=196869 RepID=UPI0013D3419F|nr:MULTISPECIES: UDP-N-acetylmuramoyl-L-alanine--D-glutamate ligase [unclassified Flavobacterium]MBA5791929.1 UDP-N-acetylmuramoyl-L-alanine--D-glutamate ligase [Flavobacterium sp. xlx-221]QMI84185.1 UDP-N-acetylmuramoyl-L-alanine--D-glutamate ligase [Flavobacterium sp. xlx-214]